MNEDILQETSTLNNIQIEVEPDIYMAENRESNSKMNDDFNRYQKSDCSTLHNYIGELMFLNSEPGEVEQNESSSLNENDLIHLKLEDSREIDLPKSSQEDDILQRHLSHIGASCQENKAICSDELIDEYEIEINYLKKDLVDVTDNSSVLPVDLLTGKNDNAFINTEDLDGSTETDNGLNIKQVRNKSSKLYSCTSCDFHTEHKGNLNTHVRVIHNQIKSFSCDLCSYRTGRMNHLRRHVRTVHENIKPYSCKNCRYNAAQKCDLDTHIRTVHENLKPFSCSFCPFSTGQKVNLQTHIRTVHEHKKPYHCKLCSFATGHSNHLRTHVRIVHEKLKPFVCGYCTYKAGQKSNLVKHLKRIHKDVDPNDIITFINSIKRQKVEIRINSSIDLKKYSCSVCAYNTDHKNHLRRHIKTVHENIKPFTCSQCEYSAAQKCDLQTHIRTVHEHLKPFSCDVCQFTTGQRSNLRTHVRTVHEKLKPFSCNQCSFITGHKTHLKTHVRTIHDKLRPFSCSHCSYSASQKTNLRKHLKRIHKMYDLHSKPIEQENEGEQIVQNQQYISIPSQQINLQHQNIHQMSCLQDWQQQYIPVEVEKGKAFTCNYCSYSGFKKDNLQKHIRRVHKNIDESINDPQSNNKSFSFANDKIMVEGQNKYQVIDAGYTSWSQPSVHDYPPIPEIFYQSIQKPIWK